MRNKSVLARLLCAAVVLLASVGVSSRAEAQFVVGMNMARHTYYSSAWPFTDMFKEAGGWSERGTHYPTLNLDSNGWPLLQPGQMAETLLFCNVGGHYPVGEYVMTYSGTGTFALYYDCVLKSSKPGEVRFTVSKPSNLGMDIRLTSSDPNNPVKNIKLTPPNLPAGYTGTFHPTFLSTIRPFPVIRFMEWQLINYVQPVTWSNRTLPTAATQAAAKYGVAYEYMIQLCNETNSDPWVCIPHMADDNYITQMATLFRDTLRKDRKVYLEWSNEAWNYFYPQAVYCINKAKASGLSYPQVMGDEAKRTFAIWSKVFAGQTNRLVRVAAGQHYNPWVLQTMLTRMGGNFDAVSCGGYFFPRDADIATFNSTTTAQQVLQSCSLEIDRGYGPNMAAHKALADQYSKSLGRTIPLLVYEGGQHLAPGSSSPWYQASLKAQTDPMMGTVYDKMIATAKAKGVSLFMAYHLVDLPNQYGAFGHLPWQDQSTSMTVSPKYATLLKYTTRK
jgi:hypothetical protein